MEACRTYSWPGNVRELRNVIERALILGEGDISADLIPSSTTAPAGGTGRASGGFVLPPGGVSLERVEDDLVRQAMAMAQDNQTRAAKLLGISRDALRYKLKKLDGRTGEEPEDEPGGIA
jgi:DNA-binding NtrC family response regulator